MVFSFARFLVVIFSFFLDLSACCRAFAVLDKLEIHYTPKHGSWLNMAEIELSILSRQSLDRRIPDQGTLKKEITAWQNKEMLLLSLWNGDLPMKMLG